MPSDVADRYYHRPVGRTRVQEVSVRDTSREGFAAKLQARLRRTEADHRATYREAIGALAQQGIETFPALLGLTRDSTQDTTRRGTACWLLGWLGDKDAAPVLLT